MKKLITFLTLGLLLIAGQVWGVGYHGTSLTPADSRSSFAANDSWLAWDGLDFSAYGTGNWEVILTDSSGYRARGIAGVVGTGEALGGELILTGNCANSGAIGYDTFDGATPTGFHAIKSSGGNKSAGTADELVLVVGSLNKRIAELVLFSGTTPTWRLTAGIDGVLWTEAVIMTAGSNTEYSNLMLGGTGIIYFVNSTNVEYTLSVLSSKQVTEPAATGIHILDGPGGSAAWAEIDSSFDYNDIVEIEILPAATLTGVIISGGIVN